MLVAALAAAVVVLLWLVVPEAVIITLLLLRSSVDGIMELFTLFAGSPLSMNLSGATNSLAVGLGVLTLVRRLVRRQPLLVSAPGGTYAIYLLICLLSLPGFINAPVAVDGFDLAVGIKEWARLASGLAIFLMVSESVKDERSVRRFTVVVMASSLIPLFLGWYQVLTGTGYFFLGFVGTEFAYRPQGTFAHPGGLGAYLVLLLTLSACLFFSTSSRVVRVLLLVWAGVAAGCLLLTMARTNWLGMMVAALTVGLLKRRRLALLSLVAAGGLLAAIPLLQERLVASESVQWRLDLWQVGVQLAWPPMLLGRGLGSSSWLVNHFLPKVSSPPHNDYLKALIETGLMGLLAYGAWLVVLVRHGWRAYRRAGEWTISWRGLGLLASVAAIIAMSLSDNVLGHTAVQWYLWALIALVPAGGSWPRSEQSSPLPDRRG
jgi:O-antigen ligase